MFQYFKAIKHSIKYLNSICKTIVLLSIVFCNAQNKKTNMCGTEKQAIMAISKLFEVKKQQTYIDSISKFTKGLSYMSEDDGFKNKDCFRIKVGYSGEFHWDTYFIFYINKENCDDIYIDEVVSGEIITLFEWRRRNNIKNPVTYKIKDPDGYTNLRKGKSKESEILQKIPSGEKIQVLDKTNDWYLVKTKAGNQGYVFKTKIVFE